MEQFSNHAYQRLTERTDMEVDRKDIIKAVENRNLVFARKISSTKSLVYAMTPKGIIKLVLHKPTKKIVTILTWKSIFKFTCEFISPHYDQGMYQAEIYPDCFLETGCSTALTKIVRIHRDGAKEPINYIHPFFDGVFKEAWELFEKANPNHQEVKSNEIKAETHCATTNDGYATQSAEVQIKCQATSA